MTALHVKYAPILRFHKDEKFFPMRVDDMLAYSSLYVKDQVEPLVSKGQVTPAQLAKYGANADVFLRTVQSGPLRGKDVVAEWGEDALEMVYRWAARRPANLTERVARQVYHWFNRKTESAAQLFWWNDLLPGVLEKPLKRSSKRDLPRLILPAATHADALAHYRVRYKGTPDYAYYYREVKDGQYLCLQYWFFYSYNDWGRSFSGMNDHEGDWEGMMLFFKLDAAGKPQEPPAYVTFADHESRQTKPWGHDDLICVGNHPVGFVAAGSHATYPQAGTHILMKAYNLIDYANADGVTIDADAWTHRIDLDTVGWLGDYAGSCGTRFWLSLALAKTMLQAMLGASVFGFLIGLKVPAEVELPGVSAPRGPVGPHRPQYANPVAWAGVPE